MALPTIVPTGFQGDYTDFFQTKVDRDGCVRRAQGSVSIPSATAAATIVGLFPFNAGMSFAGLGGFNVHCADLDTATSVTLNVGVAYQSVSEGTDDLDLITSLSTAPQAGGFVAPDETTWMNYVTTGNGWVVVSTAGATTTTTGSVTFNIPFTYDQPVI